MRRRKQVARKYRPDVEEPGPTAPAAPDGPVRLNKFLARSGVASRREADAIIAAGRVTVNGDVVTEMGIQVQPSDRVTVDGHPIGLSDLVYILLNKPTNAITTTDDERGRRTVLDLVTLPPAVAGAVFPVGRLDRATTGALLLTSDGELAHRLMHPRYGAVKVYLVTTERPPTMADVDQLRAGVLLDDGPAKADEVTLVDGAEPRLAIQLHEGRNRQVRRMMEALGHSVVALDRVGYAGMDLADLRRGKWRHLQPHEVNRLRRSVKLKSVVFEPRSSS